MLNNQMISERSLKRIDVCSQLRSYYRYLMQNQLSLLSQAAAHAQHPPRVFPHAATQAPPPTDNGRQKLERP